MFPFIATVLLYKKFQGSLEFECDNDLKEHIKEFVSENLPPAAMSLKDLLSFVKQSGMVPFEMLQPGLEWFSNNFGGEIRIFV